MIVEKNIEALNTDSQARPSSSATGARRPLEGRACESAELPKRKSLPHFSPIECSNQSIVIFLTACTKNRRQLLNNGSAHGLILSGWKDADAWLVGRYVVMPDHIHLFCAPSDPEYSFRKWVSRWRAFVSRHWPNADDKPIWQKDFFDRQLRTDESYDEKWAYVVNNPVRAGLVQRAADWPYQGALNDLEWHDAA